MGLYVYKALPASLSSLPPFTPSLTFVQDIYTQVSFCPSYSLQYFQLAEILT